MTFRAAALGKGCFQLHERILALLIGLLTVHKSTFLFNVLVHYGILGAARGVVCGWPPA